MPLSSSEALDSATAYMLREGFTLEPRTETSATFTYYEEANVALGCFLMLLFILPGILYLLLAGGEQRITLFLTPEGEGQRVMLGGDSARGRVALMQWGESFSSNG